MIIVLIVYVDCLVVVLVIGKMGFGFMYYYVGVVGNWVKNCIQIVSCELGFDL